MFLETLPNNMWWCRWCLTFFLKGFWRRDSTIFFNYLISLFAKSFPEVHPFIFTAGFYITGRSLFQCLMCVERYLAVVHPVTFLKNKLFCSAVSWFTALSSCFLVCLLYWNIMFMCYFLLQLLLFLSVNLFCSVSVLWALKKPGPGERGKERKEDNHMKRRAFYLILITTVTMFTIFVPVIIAGFLYILSPQKVSIFTSFSLPCFITPVFFLQPVLYLKRVGQLSYLCCWSFLNGILFVLIFIITFFSPPDKWSYMVLLIIITTNLSLDLWSVRDKESPSQISRCLPVCNLLKTETPSSVWSERMTCLLVFYFSGFSAIFSFS